MAVQTFGVAHGDISSQYYPHWRGGFSTDSRPNDTAVGDHATDAGAILAGKLAIKNLSAASIAATATTSAYRWCAKAIKLMTAIRVMEVATSQDKELLKAWRDELAMMWKDLDMHGAVALGDGATEADGDNPGGPITHISAYGLDIGDPPTDASDVVPVFRRKDFL